MCGVASAAVQVRQSLAHGRRFRLGVVFVLVVPEVLRCRRARLMAAIASCHRPNRLQRQEKCEEHEDEAVHGAQYTAGGYCPRCLRGLSMAATVGPLMWRYDALPSRRAAHVLNRAYR